MKRLQRLRRLLARIFTRQRVPFIATALVCVLLYGAAGLMYGGFFEPQIVSDILSENAYLGIIAIGMTFVILSGGIDLSVGSVVGCTSIVIGMLVQRADWHPAWAIALVLFGGIALGAFMGSLIHFFALPPFLVTLGGLFFCRGLALLISEESVAIEHELYMKWSAVELPLGTELYVRLPAMVFLAVLVIAIFVSLYLRFGRNVYAIGGSENSALLMGLPVGRTKIGIYALSGFCAAFGGVVHTIYTSSGNAIAAAGLELDAIAAVVVGGTLLTGGVGYVAGTLLGVIIFGIIQLAIIFDGRLTSWWTKIVIGMLLLIFILLQKLLQFGKGTAESA